MPIMVEPEAPRPACGEGQHRRPRRRNGRFLRRRQSFDSRTNATSTAAVRNAFRGAGQRRQEHEIEESVRNVGPR
jgi:hypothetical protein